MKKIGLFLKRIKNKIFESFLENERLKTLDALCVACKYKDCDTSLHNFRVSQYCYLIAKGYGLCERKAMMLKKAAPMHDIGKIGIPDSILLKPDKLSLDEWEIMTSHCKIGSKIIGKHDSGALYVAQIIARQHHERWDGCGYPDKLKGVRIDINARIIALADVFDALISKREYKEAWTIKDAISYILSQAGYHFDPEVISAFKRCMPEIIALIQAVDLDEESQTK